MQETLNIESIFSLMANSGIDYIVLKVDETTTSSDMKDFIKFTGSNAVAIICKNGKCSFFTDARYTQQANIQIDPNYFTIKNLSHANIKQAFDGLENAIIALNYEQFTAQEVNSYIPQHMHNKLKHIDLYQTLGIPTKKIENDIFMYDTQYTGTTFAERLSMVVDATMPDNSNQQLLITNPHSSSWLLGIRKKHAYDMSVNCSILISANTSLKLFTDQNIEFPEKNIEIHEIDKVADHVNFDSAVVVDSASIKYQSIKNLEEKNFTIISKIDEIAQLRSEKTALEIENFRRVHIKDGVAVTKFLFWIEHEYKKGNVTELGASTKLAELRRKDSSFLYESFETISAFGPHSSIIHYTPNQDTNANICQDSLYLVDSGGHYMGGTTDVTRTIPIGNPTQDQKFDFTMVLKAHIAIASAIFPIGTTGSDLDTLARENLWRNCCDYPHSTGHGVGNLLHVHEGPYGIGKKCNHPIKENIVLSNEPGLYRENKYGIRIENLVFTKKVDDKFLKFEQLTKVPIKANMVIPGELSAKEIEWLASYNTAVYRDLSYGLTGDEKTWLMNHSSDDDGIL